MNNAVLFPMFLLTFIVSGAAAEAQITITSSDASAIHKVGNVITNHLDSTVASVNIGSPGATSWDFSALKSHVTNAFESVLPASTPYFASDFPASNVVFHFTSTVLGATAEGWAYSAQGPNALDQYGEALGSVSGTDTTLIKAVYAPAQRDLPLPFTFNSQWGSDFTITNAMSYNGIPVMTTVAHHTETVTVDAYGPMTMPGGAVLQVLRVRRDDRYTSPSPPFYVRTLSYSFLAKSGAAVEVVASDTNAANSGIIQTDGITWSSTTSTAGTPNMQLSTTTLSFGAVTPGAFKELTVTATNTGNDTLRIASIASQNAAFTIQPASLILPPAQSSPLTVRFAPTATGQVNSKITCVSNAPTSPDEISVSGNGIGTPVLHISQRNLSFGIVKIGELKFLTTTISNTGTADLPIMGITSTQPMFSSLLNAFQLAPSASLVDSIRFAPSAVGLQSGLLIVANGFSAPPDTITMSGVGEAPTPIEVTGTPRGYSLEQNYPNPVHASTTFTFSLPAASHVTLEIYTMMGMKVKTVVDEKRSAGVHEIPWSTAGMQDGMYIYRFSAGEFTGARKLVLHRE